MADMQLVPFDDNHVHQWRRAVDATGLSPSPLGGPEFSATMQMSWGKNHIFQAGNLLIPLSKESIRHKAVLKSRLYTGVRFNSLLGIETVDDDTFRALAFLGNRCFVKLHIPEEIYLPNRERFHSLDYYPEDSYEYFKIPLPAAYEEWFNGPGICRKNIVRALDSDVSVGLGGVELLDQFYEMYMKSFSRWKSKNFTRAAHNKERFKRMFTLPGSKTKIALAFYNGKTISAAIFCNYDRTAGAFSAGTDYRFQGLRPSDLVQSEIIRDLTTIGVKEYNLGGNLGSKTLGRFKKKLGGKPFRSYLLGRHRFPRIKNIIKGITQKTMAES
jgi:hypothetical protein